MEADEFAAAVQPATDRLLRAAWLLTRDWNSAEDLVQTALIETWRRRERLRDPVALEAYVRRVMFTSLLRGRRRRWNSEVSVESVPESPAHDVADPDLRLALMSSLRKLPKRQQVVIVLRYFSDLTEAQTAHAMGCSIGSVKKQTHRALAKLRADGALDIADHLPKAGWPMSKISSEDQIRKRLATAARRPPRTLTSSDIADLVRSDDRRHPRRRRTTTWATGIGAAALALATVALVVVVRDGFRSGEGAAGPTSIRTSVPSGPSASPTASVRPVLDGPWHVTALSSESTTAASLIGAFGNLYGLGPATLTRIAPDSGITVASMPVSENAQGPVASGSLIWILDRQESGRWRLTGHDPTSLAIRKSIGIDAGTSTPLLATGASPTYLYVATPGWIDKVRADSGQIVSRFPTTFRAPDSLAVTPDGSAVYVAMNERVSAAVARLSTATGAVETSTTARAKVVTQGLTATDKGLWVIITTGMSEGARFYPAGKLDTTPTATVLADSTLPATVTIQSGTVWLGGPVTLACADPTSGKFFASAKVHTPFISSIGNIVTTDGHWYGTAQTSLGSLLVRLTPPPACRT